MIAVLLTSWVSQAADCIEAPQRRQACPHQVYKLGKLAGMEKPAMLCICASDFEPFLQVPADPADAQLQQLKKMQLEVQIGQKIDPILSILKS